MTDLIHLLHRAVWGPWLLVIFLGTGGYLTIRSRGFQIRGFGTWMGETAGKLAASRKPGKTKLGGEEGHSSRSDCGDGEYCRSSDSSGGRRSGSCVLDVGFCSNRHDDCLWGNLAWNPLQTPESRWEMDMRPHGYIGRRGEKTWPCLALRAALRAGVSWHGKDGTGQFPG